MKFRKHTYKTVLPGVLTNLPYLMMVALIFSCSEKGHKLDRDIECITEDGRKVILKADGSWDYSSKTGPETVVIGGEEIKVEGMMVEAVADTFIDGDTFEIKVRGNYPGLQRRETVRLIGVDAPELHAGDDGKSDGQFYSEEALDYIAGRLSGKTIYLLFDPERKRDSFCRLLAYTCLRDGSCINAELLRKGLARLFTQAEDRFYHRFLDLQNQAINQGKGLWGKNNPGVFIIYIYNHGREEYLLLKNGGNRDKDISNWYIRDQHGEMMRIPEDTIIKPGSFLKICSGDSVCEDPGYRLHDKTIWNNSGDTAYLYDQSGILRDIYRYGRY